MTHKPLLPLGFAVLGCGISLLGVARGQTGAEAAPAASASESASAPASASAPVAPPPASASAPPPAAAAPIAATPDYPSTALTGKTDKSFGESPVRMLAGLFLAGLPLSNRNIAGVFGYGLHSAKSGVLDGFAGHSGDVESSAFKTLGFHFAGAGRWTTGSIGLDLDFSGSPKALDGAQGFESKRKLGGSFFYSSGINVLGPLIGGRWAALGLGPAIDAQFGGQTEVTAGGKSATYGTAARLYPGIDAHLHGYVGPVMVGGHFTLVPKTILVKGSKADDTLPGVDAAAWKTRIDDATAGSSQIMRFYAALGYPLKNHPRDQVMMGIGLEGTIRTTNYDAPDGKSFSDHEFRMMFGLGLSVSSPSAQAARGAE